jgi:SET domain-containing protein 6
LFGDENLNLYYSLEIYHIMGSRILSRSFHVEAQSGIDNYHWIQTQAHVDAEMSLDEPEPSPRAPDHINSDEAKNDEDTDDEDDPANVAMVPLADLLNARSGWQNVRVDLC